MPETDWKFEIGYDNRFGYLKIQAVNGGAPVPPFYVSMPEVLRNIGIAPYELKKILEMSKEQPRDYDNIEPIRRQLLANYDFTGKMVLDIGGYDGSMAAITLAKGAKRAICLDNLQYHHYGWEDKKFEGVEYITGDFMEWNEPVDITIFYNILYHIKNPWCALDHIKELTKETMFLCTLFRYHDGPWMYVYEPRECNPTDISVYFGPSIMALERLLKATGWQFKQEGIALDRVVYTCKPDPNFEEHPWKS